MQIIECICELIYEQNCIIIPNFGGLICSYAPASIDTVGNLFVPSYKRITFNQDLLYKDDTLATHVSKHLHISNEEAVELISNTIKTFRTTLKNEDSLRLNGIGEFYYEKKKLLLKQDMTVNYLFYPQDISFPYIAPPKKELIPEIEATAPLVSEVQSIPPIIPEIDVVSPTVPEIKVEPLDNVIMPHEQFIDNAQIKPKRSYLLFAVSIFCLIVLGGFSWLTISVLGSNQDKTSQVKNNHVTTDSTHQTHVPSKIHDTIHSEMVLSLPKKIGKTYCIIAECYKIKTPKAFAFNRIKSLKQNNFDAEIIDTINNKIYRVGFGSFNSKSEAKAQLKKVRKTKLLKDAWVDNRT